MVAFQIAVTAARVSRNSSPGTTGSAVFQRQVVRALAIPSIGVGQHVHGGLRHQVGRGHRFELADGVGEHHHRADACRRAAAPSTAPGTRCRRCRPASCLMSNWPDPGLARDNSRRMRTRMLRTSCAQRVAPHAAHEQFDAHAFELGAQIEVPGHRARVQQRLVFPGPGFLLLVFDEGADARDQHAALARGTQPHVDFVEPPGRRVHGQDVQHALREADEEHLVVDRLGRVGFRLFALPESCRNTRSRSEA